MNFLQSINHYSLDVAAGAMISSVCFAHVLSVELSNVTVLLLGLTVWVIYTFDHLDDARNLKDKAITKRHYLHQKHFRGLSLLLALSLMLCALMVFFIPQITLLWGTALFLLVAIYFVVLKFLKSQFSYFKEVAIAVIYCGGILIGPVSIFQGSLEASHYVLFVQFSLVALSNLILFAVFEEASDRKQQFPSLVQVIGTSRSKWIIHSIFFAQLLLTSFLISVSTMLPLSILLVCMSGLLSLLVLKHSIFRHSYRLLGDGIFMMPAFLLFV